MATVVIARDHELHQHLESEPCWLPPASLARNARNALGLKPKPWVKTSLAPGSRRW